MATDAEWRRVVCLACDDPQAGAVEVVLARILAGEPGAVVVPWERVSAVASGTALDRCPQLALGPWIVASAPRAGELPVVLVPGAVLRDLTAAVLGLESSALAFDEATAVAFDWPLDARLEPRCASLGTLDWPPLTTGGRAGFPSGPAAAESESP